MELRQLRHLLAVIEHGSFSRAAEAVHLTQPALSRSIQALETEVGATVLERNRGAMTPTDVGRLLLRHARLLDTVTRDLERDIALTQGLELGELRIGVGPYGGSALVGPAIGQLNRLHPGLRIKAVLAPWQELPDRARARDVDLIVVEPSQVQQMDDFSVQSLSEHTMVAVCQPTHPLAQQTHPALADILRYPLAGPTLTPTMLAALQALLPAALREPLHKRGALAVECDLASMLKDVLRHSDAVSIMPAFMVAAEVASGQLACLRAVDMGLRVRFGCAWLKARTISPVAQRFMDLLTAHDRSLVAHSEPTP
jgi:DNA-binding transcriptional LysR family regulator